MIASRAASARAGSRPVVTSASSARDATSGSSETRCGRTAATAAAATVGSAAERQSIAAASARGRRQAFEDAEQRRLSARVGGGERLDDDTFGARAGDGQACDGGLAGDGRTVDDVVDEGGDRRRRPAGKGHGRALTGRPRKGISRRSKMIVYEVT